MLVSLLAFVFVLGILVILHEAGHFLAARALGAEVEVFSVGFGKRLWGIERGGTDYRVSAFPFGGYVRIVGLGPDESSATGASVADDELLPRFKRALILLAGPVTNVVFAVVFLALAFMLGVEIPAYREQPAVVGWVEPESPAAAAGVAAGDHITALDGEEIATWRQLETSVLTAGSRTMPMTVERDGRRLALELTPTTFSRYGFGYAGVLPPLDTTVVQLLPGSPAERAGIRPGDRITAVAGEPVSQFYDLMRLISPRPAEATTIEIERDGTRQTLEVVPDDQGGEGKIGIALVFPTELERYGPVAAIAAGFTESRRMTRETFRVLGRLVTRKAPLSQVSGPLDIARISGDAARSGLNAVVWLLGLISLQLGIFNLLPIPILDGGHLTIIAFESIIRRDLSLRLKERILEVGFVMLLVLMVVVLFNDIVKLLPDSIYSMIFGS